MATRDMTEAQFRRALKRNGLTWEWVWIWDHDDEGRQTRGTPFQYIRGRVNFRATLAYALHRRSEAEATSRRKSKENGMTIYGALKARLGREPTNAELKAEVERIRTEALVERAEQGKLAHQKRR